MSIDVATTRMSSKGQIVIPTEMREDFEEGTKILVIKNEDQIIIKRADKVGKNFEDDLNFAKETEKAFQKYVNGGFKSMQGKDFLRAMKKW